VIEKVLPLEIPPGIVKNGTLYERAGRWADGNLVRFDRGVPKALGGALSLGYSVGSSIPAHLPWGAFAWFGTTQPNIVVATGEASNSAVTLVTQNNGTTADTDDITPVSVSGGNSWHFDNMGDVLVAMRDGGAIYEWTGSGVLTDTGAPGGYYALGVTDENFLMGARIDGTVAWASQGTTGTWTPASTNSAGSLSLSTRGKPRAMRRQGGRSLLWTTRDLWSLDYVGAPLYYGRRQVGDNCGLIAPRAVVVINDVAYWMSHGGFFRFDGYIQPVPCEISDAIFGDLNTARIEEIHAVVNALHNEIWWFWPSAAGSAADRIAIYNYVDQVWSLGTLTRGAGVDSGYWPHGASSLPRGPIMFSASTAYVHEQTDSVLSGAYIESGPVLLDPAGAQLLRVQKLVPDNNQTTAAENGTLYVGTYPKVAESSTAIVLAAAGGEIDVREQGRYVRIKQELTRIDSRVGKWRVGLVAGERR
jgi:hypothetical protein